VEQDHFVVREPSGAEIPVVVEIPHAGVHVPAPYLADLVVPARSLGRDADLYVDELYEDAPLEGASVIAARTSRYVLDLNRGEDDWDAEAVDGAPPHAPVRMPRGVIWRISADGDRCLAAPLPLESFTARLDALHRPYHRALGELLVRKRARFGYAVLLAAHSMPSAPRGRDDSPVRRADVVPGTQGRTTAAASFIDAVEDHAMRHGLSVRHDDPYRGGFTTRHYGRPLLGVHAVQVELARRLYMDETTLTKSRRFDATRLWCRTLVAKLGQTALP